MRKYIFLITLLIVSFGTFAQQEAMYSQYVFNPLAINPAMSSSPDAPIVKLIYRKKFMGADFEGDPQTQTFVAELPLKNEKMGLAFQLYNDIAGVIKSTGAYGIYNYKVKFTDQVNLRMGIQAGITNFRANLTSVQLIDPKDPNFGQNINKALPSVGTGLNLTNDTWYVALSCPQVIKTDLSLVESPNYSSSSNRLYFGMVGYKFRMNRNNSLDINVLAKVVESAPVAFDYNVKLNLFDKLVLGSSFRLANDQFNLASNQARLGNALVAFMEVKVTPRIRFGYAYNIQTGKAQYDSGAHEVMLSYSFWKDEEEESEILDPRFR
jgi:type IX secretion system PorP/SprF family membrane protein